jgi:large subunit ribosomal protein L22
MGKQKQARRLKPAEAMAKVTALRTSPRKLNLVAQSIHSLDIDNLVVAEAYVGKNLTMKRFSPRARGRANRIEKPFSEITIVVREPSEAA